MSAIEASLRLEISQYQQALARATGEVVKFKENAKRESRGMAEAVMGKPDDYVFRGKYADSFRRSVQAEGSIGGGLMGQGLMSGMARTAGVASIAALIGGGLMLAGRRAAQDKVMQIRGEVLIGGKDEAREFIDDLRSLGARTPLEFPELADAGQQLVAFGVAAKEVPETLRRIGDVSTGVKAPLGEIAEIYGKARVQNQLFAEDINQLTGRGIPVIQEFARILGVPEAEIKKLASEGKITFPMLEAAFVNLTNEGGKFGGMMDRISQTSTGKWSTVKDDLGSIATTLGKPIDAASNWGLDKVLSITGGIKSLLTTNFFLPEKAADKKPAATEKPEDKEAALRAAFEAAEAEKEAVKAAEEANKAAADKAKQMERIRSLQENVKELEISRLDPANQLVRLTDLQKQKIDEMRAAGGLFFEATVAGMEKFAAAQAKNGSDSAEETLRKYESILRIQQQMDSLSAGLRESAASSSEGQSRAEDAQLALFLEEMITEDLEYQKQLKAETGLAEEIALLQAKANGQTQLVEAMERELAIREKTAEIMSRTGMGEAEARNAATKIEDLKGQAADRDKGAPSSSAKEEAKDKILGFSRARQGGAYERQDHLYDDPRQKRNPANTLEMLGPKAERNAQAQSPQSQDNGLMALLQQIAQNVALMPPLMQ